MSFSMEFRMLDFEERAPSSLLQRGLRWFQGRYTSPSKCSRENDDNNKDNKIIVEFPPFL
jgi:hypothetical protein